jgi:hypothetical protein
VPSHINFGRGEEGEDNVNRKLTLTLTLIVLLAGMFFTEPLARADIVNFNLSSATFAGMPGQNVDFLEQSRRPGPTAMTSIWWD